MGLEQRGVRSPHDRPLNRVDRAPQVATLRLVDGTQIEGTMHIPLDLRIVDFLNQQTEGFLVVTKAAISGAGEQRRVPFIVVNKAHIVYTYPSAEVP